MRTRRRSWTAAATLLAAFASLTGCVRTAYEDRPQPPVSRIHSRGTVIGRPLAFEQAKTEHHDLRLPRTEHGVVLAGDVHGRGGSEVVVVERAGVLVFGTDGKLLTRVEAREPVLTAGVLADVDRDGRSDIVTGVAGGADPVVRVFNGRGSEILTRRLESQGKAFGAVRPAAVRDDAVYVVATENWIAGPRGVVRLSLPRLEPSWFSAVPTGLAGLAIVGDRIVVSNRTQHNGEFSDLGVDRRQRFGFDATAQLLVLDPDGSPRVERALGGVDPDGVRSVWHVPIGPQTVVAHLVAGEERVLLADAASGAVLTDRTAGGRVRGLVSFPASRDVGYAVVTDRADGWTLTIVSPGGTVVSAGVGTGPRPRLLALLGDEAAKPSFLAISDGRIVIVDASDAGDAAARSSPGLPTTITGSVLVTQNEHEVLVAGLGASLELVRIPFAESVLAADHQ